MKRLFLILSFYLVSTYQPITALHKKTLIVPCSLIGIYGISYALFKTLASGCVKPTLIPYKPYIIKCKAGINYYLFAHGLSETHEHVLNYAKGFTSFPFIIDGFIFTYDYPDVTNYFWQVNWMYTALGQGNEIACLKHSYEQAVQYLQKKKISEKLILFGISRGAPTILNFVGLYKPKQVKALILESPFDSTRSLSDNVLSFVGLDKNPLLQMVGHCILSTIFWQHSIRGEQAKDCVLGIKKNLPILLVCSKKDKVVPWRSTYKLYKILRQNGYPYVHIFIAQEGKHARIMQGPEGSNYQRVTQAFYKKYGCAYDEILAQEGEDLFQDTQPTV